MKQVASEPGSAPQPTSEPATSGDVDRFAQVGAQLAWEATLAASQALGSVSIGALFGVVPAEDASAHDAADASLSRAVRELRLVERLLRKGRPPRLELPPTSSLPSTLKECAARLRGHDVTVRTQPSNLAQRLSATTERTLELVLLWVAEYLEGAAPGAASLEVRLAHEQVEFSAALDSAVSLPVLDRRAIESLEALRVRVRLLGGEMLPPSATHIGTRWYWILHFWLPELG